MNNAKKRILLIGGWCEIYEQLATLDAHIVLFHEKDSVSSADFPLIDEIYTVGLSGDKLLKLAEHLHCQEPFDYVVSFTEYGLEPAARLAEKFGLPTNPLQAVMVTRNKLAMREVLRHANRRDLPFKAIYNPKDLSDFAQEAGLPLIVKPIDGTGSKDVHLVNNMHNVEQIFEKFAMEGSAGALIAEKFIDGDEYSVETFSSKGRHTTLCITAKRVGGKSGFVEVGHTIPAKLDSQAEREIEQVVTDLLNTIGHQEGPAHTEVKFSGSECFVIESHTRTGGDRIFELVKLTYGVNLFSEAVRSLMSPEPIDVRPSPACAAAIEFVSADRKGTLVSVHGIERAQQMDGVFKCVMQLDRIGSVVDVPARSFDRLGYVIATGHTSEEAEARAKFAAGQVKLEIH